MKSVVKSLRFSKEQYEIIEKAMKEQELNFSEYALLCMLKQKAKRKQNPIHRAFINELAKWGNNLNQVAKHLNTNKAGLDRVAFEMLKRIEEHLQAIRAKNGC